LSATNVGKNCHQGEEGVKRNKGGVGKVVESTPGRLVDENKLSDV